MIKVIADSQHIYKNFIKNIEPVIQKLSDKFDKYLNKWKDDFYKALIKKSKDQDFVNRTKNYVSHMSD